MLVKSSTPCGWLAATLLVGLLACQPVNANSTSPRPSVSSRSLNFSCAKSFTGKGTGLCKWSLMVTVSELPRDVFTAEAYCTAVFRYGPMDLSKAKLKEVSNSGKIEVDLGAGKTVLELELDATSLMDETQHVEVVSSECSAKWVRGK